MLGENLLVLAALAGRTVVDAATTDGWETAERAFAQLLGRGDAKQTKQAEQWLKETRKQLAGGDGADMELIRTALAGRWAGRWADLLEESPDAEAGLRALIHQIQAALPAEGHLSPATRFPPTATSAPTQPVPSTRAPWPRGANSPTRPDRRATRPPRGTSSPRCCRSPSASSAPSTPTPWPPAPAWPTGPGRRATRPPPGTSSPRCCRWPSACSAPSIRTP